MWSMTSSPVIGTGGWADRLPVVSRLKQNVSDLSDYLYMLAEAVGGSHRVVTAPAMYKARHDLN